VRIGINLPVAASPSRDSLRVVALAAEELGYDSVWANSHTALPVEFSSRYPYSPDGRPRFKADSDWADALVSLAFVAGFTERVRLGTCVIPLINSDPLTLAKQAATVDLVSGGRLELGIGAGWLVEEGAVLGHPTDHRTGRLEETIEIVRLAWTRQLFSFEGKYFRYPEVGVNPPPPQGARLPIWIGGHGQAAVRICAEKGCGLLLWLPDANEVHDFRARLSSECPLAVSMSLTTAEGRWREAAEELRDAGADLLILTRRYSREGLVDDLHRFAEDALTALV
jgi:probable F420-dependent oxidoreductase